MVKIMLDSASDSYRLGLWDYYIPITISIAGKEYRDGIDLNSDTFYSLLQSAQDFPKTSQPSPQAFIEYFKEVKRSGDELVYIALSGALSGTLQSATIAKEMVDYDKIYIVDSKAATHLIVILAMVAREMASSGATGAQIAEKCEALREKLRVYAGLQTLEYLYKGGRLSRASAAIGEIANIKPILTITAEGKVEPIAKAIGVPRAIATITKKLSDGGIDRDYPIWSICSVDPENCEKLEAAMEKAGCPADKRVQLGATIGAHIGPGLYGVIFVEK